MVTVTDTFALADGTPDKGTITFRPVVTAVDSSPDPGRFILRVWQATSAARRLAGNGRTAFGCRSFRYRHPPRDYWSRWDGHRWVALP